MSNPLQIGITGGIGSGKTLVSKIFACLGIPVYDADSHAKELMTTDGILVSQIKKEFGDLSYLSDGTLNRKYLSEVVFNKQERLDVLNKLVHPRVGENYTQWVKRHNNKAYVLKEAALLFETGSYQALDKIIVVHAPEEVRIKRVIHRDGRAEQQVREIIRKQMSEEEKLKRADFIIYNDESSLIIPQVLSLHNRLQMQIA
ncbi:dephospho-CoA kinase [Ohtaekwangia kribbensis]|uniref:Dephospho-CoA kinase n=1 Tax=Ohtaekwangia kribbensis TaxID=688913 RepID=A0ABW3K8Z9_9BACT